MSEATEIMSAKELMDALQELPFGTHIADLIEMAFDAEVSRLDKMTGAIILARAVAETLTVDAIADNVKASNLPALARLHQGYRANIDDLAECKTVLQKAFDWLRMSHMPERMEAAELESFSVEGVGRVYLSTSLTASIKSGAKDGAYEYLTDHGHGDIIQSTVNSSSLKALAKTKLKDNDPLPAELFNVTPVTQAVIQKS